MKDHINILVIPDTHADPLHSNDRFTTLGNFIVSRKPEIIIQIGDFATMSSLSSYDVGKRKSEGRRYADDIEVTIDAQEKLFDPIHKDNRGRTRSKYEPELHITLGNHEDRINRAANDDPALYQYLTTDDLKFKEYGWNVVPFKQFLNIRNINFTHYFPNGLMDRPIGGQNPARGILQRWHCSGVQGHSHVFNTATDVKADGTRITAVVAGCYFEHGEDFVSDSIQRTWWRGVVMLNNVNMKGEFDLEQVSLESMKRDFS